MRIVEHAGLPWRHTIFASNEIDLDAVRAAAEPGRVRRTSRAHPHEHLVPAGAERLLNAALADPVDVAQPHPAGAQRLARTDDDVPRLRIEPHHIERMAGRDPKPAPLANRESD